MDREVDLFVGSLKDFWNRVAFIARLILYHLQSFSVYYCLAFYLNKSQVSSYGWLKIKILNENTDINDNSLRKYWNRSVNKGEIRCQYCSTLLLKLNVTVQPKLLNISCDNSLQYCRNGFFLHGTVFYNRSIF